MDKQGSISGVWREALAIIRRYPSALIVPGAVLGALAEVPAYFIADRLLLDQLLTYLTAAFAFYLYLVYVERFTTAYEHGGDLIAQHAWGTARSGAFRPARARGRAGHRLTRERSDLPARANRPHSASSSM